MCCDSQRSPQQWQQTPTHTYFTNTSQAPSGCVPHPDLRRIIGNQQTPYGTRRLGRATLAPTTTTNPNPYVFYKHITSPCRGAYRIPTYIASSATNTHFAAHVGWDEQSSPQHMQQTPTHTYFTNTSQAHVGVRTASRPTSHHRQPIHTLRRT